VLVAVLVGGKHDARQHVHLAGIQLEGAGAPAGGAAASRAPPRQSR